MFLGHFAAGLAASRKEPRLGLGTSFLAAQLPDAVWPWLVLAGVERVTIAPGDTAVTPLRFDSYPWSHSLVAVVAWGLVVGGLRFARSRERTAAVLLAVLVVSHWVLDTASHRPDMPVLPSGPFVGLGLWHSVPATLIVEGALFSGAIVYYAWKRKMRPSFWALVATLAVVYVVSVFGPPPPSVTALAWSSILVVPLVWFWGNRAGFHQDS